MVLGFGESWSVEGKVGLSLKKSARVNFIFPDLQHFLVTGGSAGLGLALSLLLAEEGAATVAIVARNEETLKQALQQLEVSNFFSLQVGAHGSPVLHPRERLAQ